MTKEKEDGGYTEKGEAKKKKKMSACNENNVQNNNQIKISLIIL